VTRKVACPRCGGVSLFEPENKSRPFCSERCKLMDLGAWASEQYRVPVAQDDPGAEPTEPDEKRDA